MPLTLRPATLTDRSTIYAWLARSDATPEMMGPPRFPHSPVPTYVEFCADYTDDWYVAAGDERLFVIDAEGRGIGAISYGVRQRAAEIDLWIGARGDWGRGYGPAAIRAVFVMLTERADVDLAIIRPSARNTRAIRAYRKAGFNKFDPDRHVAPPWVTDETEFYNADAVVLVFPVGQSAP